MNHILLAGDSVFDNRSYVNPGEPDVRKQVDGLLDNGDKVTLLAVDGCVTKNVKKQLQLLPDDVTHLFLSVGGNDALNQLDIFLNPISNIGRAFDSMNKVMKKFEKKYRKMISLVMKYDLNTTVCTIYHPCFTHKNIERIPKYLRDVNRNKLQKMTVTALPIFNDIILQEAVNFGIPIMDLRLIFDSDEDYANPIEPSVIGGMKMAKIIKDISDNHDFSINNSMVYK